MLKTRTFRSPKMTLSRSSSQMTYRGGADWRLVEQERLMTDSSKPQIRVFALAQDGAMMPLGGTGVRVVLAPDVWLELDFEVDGHVPLCITVGGRARRS